MGGILYSSWGKYCIQEEEVIKLTTLIVPIPVRQNGAGLTKDAHKTGRQFIPTNSPFRSSC